MTKYHVLSFCNAEFNCNFFQTNNYSGQKVFQLLNFTKTAGLTLKQKNVDFLLTAPFFVGPQIHRDFRRHQLVIFQIKR